MPQPLHPQGKSPWYPLDRRLGGVQSRYGHGGENKNSQPLLGLEIPITQPIAQHYTTGLAWLNFLYKNLLIINFLKINYFSMYSPCTPINHHHSSDSFLMPLSKTVCDYPSSHCTKSSSLTLCLFLPRAQTGENYMVPGQDYRWGVEVLPDAFPPMFLLSQW
jgi:hypothetical protein